MTNKCKRLGVFVISSLFLSSCAFGASQSLTSDDSNNSSWIVSTSTSSSSSSSGSESGSSSSSSSITGSSSSSSIVSGSSVPASSVTNNGYSSPAESSSIVLSDGASTSGSSNVSIDNDTNQITISSVGTYYLTGSLSNGSVLIDASKTTLSDSVTLILNGVSISKDCTNGINGPIYSSNNTKLIIQLVDGSSSVINDLRDSSADTEENDDTSAIFSNKKLTIQGTGSLKVTSSFNNGLGSDTKIRIAEGVYSLSAPNNVIKAHESIVLGQKDGGASFYITSTGSDGNAVRVDEVDEDVTTPVYGNDIDDDDIAGIELKDAYYEISAAGKGVSSEGYLYVEGGNGTVVSSADKGFKAELDVHIDGGSFSIKTLKDDCIHSSTANVYCSGGNYQLSSGTSSSCQGIKGEEEVHIDGGYFVVSSSNEGIAAHRIYATGGTSLVNSSDDGWSAGGTNSQSSTNCLISISGGYHYVYASGDGLDSNGNLIVSGGFTVVSAPTNGGNGPLDYGDGGSYYMQQDGGILVAYGTSGMAVGASTGNEGSVLLGSHNSVSSGQYLVFKANDSYYAVKTTRAASTTYCAFPEFVSGGAYSIGYSSSVDIKETLFSEAGLYSLSSSPSSTTLSEGTFSSLHISSGTGGGGGGFPGGGGGHGGR